MKTPRIVAVLLACCCCLALGQSPPHTVQISGRVVDVIGGGVKSASVTLASDSDEFVAAAKSAQGSGEFTFAAVLPGTYTLFVNVSGFSQKILTVDADAGKDVNIGAIVVRVGPIENTDEPIQVPAGTPIDATVCEILKDPSHFHRKNVRIRAEAGAGIDTSPALFDSNCRDGIELRLPSADSIVNDRDYRNLESHLQSRLDGPVLATIEGKIEYVLLISEPNIVSLTVERVSDVVVPISNRKR